MGSPLTFIFLYACESWTLTTELQRKIQAMEMRCYRKRLRTSYRDHITNEEVRAKIQQAIGLHENLLTIVKRLKLQWYVMFPVHQVWPKPSCKGEEGKADRGRGGKTTSGMDRPEIRQVPEGTGEQGKMEKTGCKVICGAPTTLAVKGLIMMMMTTSINKHLWNYLKHTHTQRRRKKKHIHT